MRDLTAPVRVFQDADGGVCITRIGRGWVSVSRAAWDAFTAAVKQPGVMPGDGGTPRARGGTAGSGAGAAPPA